jgi:hypothetical protein
MANEIDEYLVQTDRLNNINNTSRNILLSVFKKVDPNGLDDINTMHFYSVSTNFEYQGNDFDQIVGNMDNYCFIDIQQILILYDLNMNYKNTGTQYYYNARHSNKVKDAITYLSSLQFEWSKLELNVNSDFFQSSLPPLPPLPQLSQSLSPFQPQFEMEDGIYITGSNQSIQQTLHKYLNPVLNPPQDFELMFDKPQDFESMVDKLPDFKKKHNCSIGDIGDKISNLEALKKLNNQIKLQHNDYNSPSTSNHDSDESSGSDGTYEIIHSGNNSCSDKSDNTYNLDNKCTSNKKSNYPSMKISI